MNNEYLEIESDSEKKMENDGGEIRDNNLIVRLSNDFINCQIAKYLFTLWGGQLFDNTENYIN